MSLADVPLKLSYRTGRDNLVNDFLVPCLKNSELYRRAAGYFSSSGLALASGGIASLASRNGIMRLVVSPQLQPEDVDALSTSFNNPHDVLRSITVKSLADVEDLLVKERLNALAWLAASGLLEIKLAIRLDHHGQFSHGIFHEKCGIFSDSEGNHVAFSGSSNETAGGLVENFESIKAFCSWKDLEGRVQEEIDNFESLWNDTTPGLKVVEFSEAGRDLLDRYRDIENPPTGLMVNKSTKTEKTNRFEPPKGFDLRNYQIDAIKAWSKAGGKGIFAMATGSGKTLTALTLASKVAEKNIPLVLLIVCPFINLCQQWIREIESFGVQPIACFEGRQRWQAELEEGFQGLSLGLTNLMAIIVTNATYISEAFQSGLKSRVASGKSHYLFIADEVHNLGAERIKECLFEGISLRLGLSATPERHYDSVGTSAVIDYFGGVVFEYPLSQAIADGRLCQYRYFPVPVELTDDETDAYEAITTQLSRCFSREGENNEVNQMAMRLLIKRARLLGAAVNKLAALDKVIATLPEKPSKALFYCGDGRTTDPITDHEVRQIEAVSRILGEKHGLKIRNFTFRESTEEREEILRDLASGFLDGVVAIRCLDEGIDLPDLRMGFIMASSSNPRQFIQRRGRLLRNAPGKTRAIIYDFFVTPPDLGGKLDDRTFNMERRFLEKELGRIIEFCRMAENGAEAINQLHALRLKYNLISI